MVKGNWERRAELASVRREEAKAKKAAKVIKNTPINVIVLHLQKSMPVDTIITIWLRKETIGCSHWLRLGACENRKCRLLHEPLSDTLTKLQGLPEFSEEKHCGKDHACEEPLQSSPWEMDESTIERIQYMSLNGQLIYDHLTPTVWMSFKNRPILNPSTTITNTDASISNNNTTQLLSKIEEVFEGDEEVEEEEEDKGDETLLAVKLAKQVEDDLTISQGFRTSSVITLQGTFMRQLINLLVSITPFLDFSDLVNLFSTSK